MELTSRSLNDRCQDFTTGSTSTMGAPSNAPRRSTTLPSAIRRRSPNLGSTEASLAAATRHPLDGINNPSRIFVPPAVHEHAQHTQQREDEDDHRLDEDAHGVELEPSTITMVPSRSQADSTRSDPPTPFTTASSRMSVTYEEYHPSHPSPHEDHTSQQYPPRPPSSAASTARADPTQVRLPPSRAHSYASTARTRQAPPSRYPTPDFYGREGPEHRQEDRGHGAGFGRMQSLREAGEEDMASRPERYPTPDYSTHDRDHGDRHGQERERAPTFDSLRRELAGGGSTQHRTSDRRSDAPRASSMVSSRSNSSNATNRSVTFLETTSSISSALSPPPQPLSPASLRNRHHSPTFLPPTRPLKIQPRTSLSQSHHRSDHGRDGYRHSDRRSSISSEAPTLVESLFSQESERESFTTLSKYPSYSQPHTAKLSMLPRTMSRTSTSSSTSTKVGDDDDVGKGLKKQPVGLGLELASLAPNVTNKFPIEGGRKTSTAFGFGGGGAPGERTSAKAGSDPKRWNGFKIMLFLSVCTLFGYAMAGLVWSLTIWFRTAAYADVFLVADEDVLIFLTFASTFCLFTSIVGLSGTVLNNRPILAFYNLLLWPALLSICLIGYTSYKREAMKLDRKLNQAWSQFYTDVDRLRIQNSLQCCGFYNALHEATPSSTCYPRSPLHGCKGKLYRFSKMALAQFATAAFAVVPFHLTNIFIGLICSNHVNKTFGKGITPKQYRLSMADVRTSALSVLDLVKQRKLDASSATASSHAYSAGDDRLGDEKEWRGFRERGYERSISSIRGRG